MQRFEYEVTTHAEEQFRELVFYCNEQGECGLNDVPPDQFTVLVKILNSRGAEGWELVEIKFGKEGLIAFWKRQLAAPGL